MHEEAPPPGTHDPAQTLEIENPLVTFARLCLRYARELDAEDEATRQAEEKQTKEENSTSEARVCENPD